MKSHWKNTLISMSLKDKAQSFTHTEHAKLGERVPSITFAARTAFITAYSQYTIDLSERM